MTNGDILIGYVEKGYSSNGKNYIHINGDGSFKAGKLFYSLNNHGEKTKSGTLYRNDGTTESYFD